MLGTSVMRNVYLKTSVIGKIKLKFSIIHRLFYYCNTWNRVLGIIVIGNNYLEDLCNLLVLV